MRILSTIRRTTVVAGALGLAVAPAAVADGPAKSLPTVTVADSSRYEGTSGSRQMIHTACISKVPRTGVASVHVTRESRTATAGSDFRRRSGRLAWGQGDERCKLLTTTINADRRREKDERFALRLSDPDGVRITDRVALATITTDDELSDEITVDSVVYSTDTFATTLPDALNCPADHKYVVDRQYSGVGFTAAPGIDVSRPTSVSIYLPNVAQSYDTNYATNYVSGMLGGDSSNLLTSNSVTNWGIGANVWQIHLHCTSDELSTYRIS